MFIRSHAQPLDRLLQVQLLELLGGFGFRPPSGLVHRPFIRSLRHGRRRRQRRLQVRHDRRQRVRIEGRVRRHLHGPRGAFGGEILPLLYGLHRRATTRLLRDPPLGARGAVRGACGRTPLDVLEGVHEGGGQIMECRSGGVTGLATRGGLLLLDTRRRFLGRGAGPDDTI